MSQICAGTHPDCWRGVIKVVKIEKISSSRRNVWKQNFCVWSSLTISMIFITFSMSQIFLTVSPVGTCSLHHCLQLFLWGLTSRSKVDQRSTKKCREPFDEPTILSNILIFELPFVIISKLMQRQYSPMLKTNTSSHICPYCLNIQSDFLTGPTLEITMIL